MSASMDETDRDETIDEIIITSIFTSDQDVGRCISNIVDSIGLKELLHYEIADGRDIDWAKNSQGTFHPINVADGLWIIPARRAPIDFEASNIILDPGLAFGTREHPTTKFGAAISIGVDIDPQAIAAARTNAYLNNIHPEKMHGRGSFSRWSQMRKFRQSKH